MEPGSQLTCGNFTRLRSTGDNKVSFSVSPDVSAQGGLTVSHREITVSHPRTTGSTLLGTGSTTVSHREPP